MCLCAVSLGLAFGVVSAIFMLLLAWAGWLWGYGAVFIDQYSVIYYGYAASFVGGIVGAVWGLIGGFIFGFLSGWFYNLFLGCRCKKSCGESCGIESDKTKTKG
ncbi:MAG: hypothetical protein A3J38_04135 [Gammaproteobacteria bacterium RIFCSPHIGHO2_12_FULL_45_9]|nr:MAG: hypothetical protein A3J38_04135 [Gammaproteobacteria bacterium RIFCSPHIGHO2_12_FULL_45_9]